MNIISRYHIHAQHYTTRATMTIVGKLRQNAQLSMFIEHLETVMERHPVQYEQIPVITGELIERFCVNLGQYEIYKEFGHDYKEMDYNYVIYKPDGESEITWYYF